MKRLHYIQKSVVLFYVEKPNEIRVLFAGTLKSAMTGGTKKLPPHRRRMWALFKALSALHINHSILSSALPSRRGGFAEAPARCWVWGMLEEKMNKNLLTYLL